MTVAAGPVPGIRRPGPASAPPPADACRDLFRSMASGVTVVTAESPDGPVGMTASAVMSLSMDPPLVVLSLHRASGTLRALRRSASFALHLLRADQHWIAEVFARPGSAGEKFAGLRTRPGAGPPILADTLAVATCAVERTVDGGDHRLVIARLLTTSVADGSPLLWYRSDYHHLTHPATTARLERSA